MILKGERILPVMSELQKINKKILDFYEISIDNVLLYSIQYTEYNRFKREGEVLGFSGLMGSQRTEIVRCIFGLDKFDSGEVYLHSKRVKTFNSSQAMKNGIAIVTKDRKRDGIFDIMSVNDNLTISALPLINKFGWIKFNKEKELVLKQLKSLDIKIVSVNQPIIKLSGGNQQKVILGRTLAVNPKLLILDEPIRGIDVGAKAEIHKIISEIVKTKIAVIIISSELPEILGVSDRIIVLHQGKIKVELNYKEATQEKVLTSALT